MNHERDRAMREQEATEAMIRMRDPDKAIKPKQENMTDILDDLRDLQKQATTEHSHYYVAACCARAIGEVIHLRQALRPFAGLPETSKAETDVPNNSPVTIHCQLGDMRRAFQAINPR